MTPRPNRAAYQFEWKRGKIIMANGKWDLTFLYNGFDDPNLQKDIEKIHTLALEGRKLPESEGSDVEKLTAVMQAETELNDLLYKAFGFVQLSLATDCNNQQGQLLLDQLSSLMVEVRMTGSAWIRFVGSVEDLEGAIAQSDYLKTLAFHLRECKEQSAHMLDAGLEKWALRLSLDGGDAFSKLRDRLMGSHTVELNGESLPLPAVRGMAYDPDPKVRKEAYEVELKSYAKVETPMAFCLSSIKGQAMTLCEAKGYSDLLTQQLTETRMER